MSHSYRLGGSGLLKQIAGWVAIIGFGILFAYTLQPGRGPIWLFDDPDGRALMNILAIVSGSYAAYREFRQREWVDGALLLLLPLLMVYNQLT